MSLNFVWCVCAFAGVKEVRKALRTHYCTKLMSTCPRAEKQEPYWLIEPSLLSEGKYLTYSTYKVLECLPGECCCDVASIIARHAHADLQVMSM